MDEMLRGYLVCALWASHGGSGHRYDGKGSEEDTDFDSCGVSDFEGTSLLAMRLDCIRFIAHVDADGLLQDLLSIEGPSCSASEYAGHNLWLTRNHHGAGFIDRAYNGAVAIQEIASKEGERWLFKNENSGEVSVEPITYTDLEMLASAKEPEK